MNSSLPPCESKRVWPWEAAPPMPPRMPDGTPWPRITVVTPSFNQGQYIEETILSVLHQGYPNLEFIIMDGGSTDETTSILERYSSSLAHWVSEPDGGQGDAIAKGFERATGDLMAWLCSDDLYFPGALQFVALAHAAHPTAVLICGQTNLDQGSGWEEWMAMRYSEAKPTYIRLIASGQCAQQPGCFWTTDAYRRTAGVDRGLKFCMDYEILVKLSLVGEAVHLNREVAWMRSHPASKSSTMHSTRVAERAAIVERFLAERPVPLWRLCIESYRSTLRTLWKSDRLGRFAKLRRTARLCLSFAMRFVRGDVWSWHPVRGFGDTRRDA